MSTYSRREEIMPLIINNADNETRLSKLQDIRGRATVSRGYPIPYQNTIATNDFQIDAALGSPSSSWSHPAFSQSFNNITANGGYFNHPIASPLLTFDVCDYHVSYPTPIVFDHPSIPGQNDTTVAGHELVPSDTYVLDLQHQNAIDANGRQSNAVVNSPSLSSAYQPVIRNPSHIAAERDHFNRSAISSLTFDNCAFLCSTSIAERQFDTNFQFPDFGSNIDVGGSNGFDCFNDFRCPDDFNDTTSFCSAASELNGSANTDARKTVTEFAKVPIPFSSITTAPSGTNAQTNRFVCDHSGCTATFARAGDLARHSKKHGIPEYPCIVNNCDRKGDKAFYRVDKLRNHQRMKHKMAV